MTIFSFIKCVARKVPELCKAYTPGKADQDLNARVTRLEQIVETALPQFSSPGGLTTSERNSVHSRHRTPAAYDDDSRSLPEDHEPGGGTFDNGKWYGTSVSGSIAPGALIKQASDIRGYLKFMSYQPCRSRVLQHRVHILSGRALVTTRTRGMSILHCPPGFPPRLRLPIQETTWNRQPPPTCSGWYKNVV